MAEPRYIAVSCGNGTKAQVRVLSHHAEDDDRRQALYVANAYTDWCMQADERVAQKVGGELDKAVLELAQVRVRRDGALRELFKKVLADKHSGEEIEEMLRHADGVAVRQILWASQGLKPEPTESAAP